jgi:hypothetical protein
MNTPLSVILSTPLRYVDVLMWALARVSQYNTTLRSNRIQSEIVVPTPTRCIHIGSQPFGHDP